MYVLKDTIAEQRKLNALCPLHPSYKYLITDNSNLSENYLPALKKIYSIANGNRDKIERIAMLFASVYANEMPGNKLTVIYIGSSDEHPYLKSLLSKAKAYPYCSLTYALKTKCFRQLTNEYFGDVSVLFTEYDKSLSKNEVLLLRKKLSKKPFKIGDSTFINDKAIIAFNHNREIHQELPDKHVNFIDLENMKFPDKPFTNEEILSIAIFGMYVNREIRSTIKAKNVVDDFVSTCFYNKNESDTFFTLYKKDKTGPCPSTYNSRACELFNIYCKKKYSDNQINVIVDDETFIIRQLKKRYRAFRPHYGKSPSNAWAFEGLIEGIKKVKALENTPDYCSEVFEQEADFEKYLEPFAEHLQNTSFVPIWHVYDYGGPPLDVEIVYEPCDDKQDE